MDPDLPAAVAQFKVPVVCMHFLKYPPDANRPAIHKSKKRNRRVLRRNFSDCRKGRNQSRSVDSGILYIRIRQKAGAYSRNHPGICRSCMNRNRPILAGPSRKSFIQKITGLPAESRLEGTAAAAAMCLVQGTHVLRVHDVQFLRRFCDVFDVLLNS